MSKIFGAGIDLIEISRISNSIKNKNFIDRIYSKSEIQQARSLKNKSSFFAKRFAAKEAFSKAIGTGISEGISFKEISVVNNIKGKPTIKLSGKTKSVVLKKIKKARVHLSLSDEKNHAVAMVIIEQ
jgi:holo-[acyl-carrier protein] synthase